MKYRNIFKPTFIASIVTLAAIGLTSVTTSVKAQLDERPNVVMIVLDDMSYSDLDFYGGEIETPTLSSLADEGVLFTNFHAGSICSPSRAMFNTGVDNHRAGMGTMLETMTNNQLNRPGYEGYMNDRVVTTATLLKDAGYHTYMVGKWHLGGAEGPEQGRFPGQRGFERNFAVLDGAGDFYSNRGISGTSQCVKYIEDDQPLEELPENAPFYQCTESPLTPVRDKRTIDLDNMPDPEQGDFYATEYFTRKILEYLDEDKDDGKPFFAFVSYTTPHYPLQVPPEYVTQEDIDLYMRGWDVLREERFERMKDMGIITVDELPPAWPAVLDPNDDTAVITVDTWDSMTEEDQLQEATERAVYAGMLKYMDEQVQRIIDKLKELGKYENTMIIFFSDNGGDAHDKDTEESFVNWFNQVGIDNSNLDNLGGPLSWLTLTPGWTQLGMTPFWGEKATQTEGGTRAAFFVYYPKLNINKQNMSHAFVSVLDLTPTILDYADVEHPGINYKGRFVFPMDGKSMRPIWEGWQTDIYRDNEPIGFEVKGNANDNKSLYLGDYKIVTQVPPWGDGTWKLFNLAEDPAEQVDLSAQEPEKMAEMLAMYEEFEADIGFVPAGALDESFEPTPQTFKRPDSRLTLHADNVDNIPELTGIYEGVIFQREEYVSSFKAGGEITAHVVWGQDENGEEILYAFKTEEEVLTNLNKITAKNLKKNTIKDISSFPMVYDGILFRPDEYQTYFDQGLNIDMYLALEQRYGYPVVHAFLDKKDLVEFYQTAQDKRCQIVSANNVKEKNDSPLTVDVYWSKTVESTYVSSVLIQSENEAILVGAQNNLEEGQNVADWIEESGKKLKAIFISHAHPNRIMGIQAILDKFPGTPVYSAPEVVQEIREQNRGFFIPEPYEPNYLVLEGQCVEIMPFNNIDGMQNYTALYIHSTQTLFAADIATRGGHSLMAIGGPSYQEWFAAIEKLKAMKPKEVITGHAAPDFQGDNSPETLDDTRSYIETYMSIVSESATMEDAQAALEAKYPDYILPGILSFSLNTSYLSGAPTTASCEDDASQLDVDVYWSGEEGTYVSSLLIKGEEEAILVGAQNNLEEGQNVVDWIEESGKKLNSIFISHAHPNRIQGIQAILDKYPDTPVYAAPNVVEEIKSAGFYVPEHYKQDALVLDGQCIKILPFTQIDGMKNYTALYIPSTQTLFTADIATRGGHSLMAIGGPSYQNWFDAIDQLKAMDLKEVITGHAAPAFQEDRGPETLDDTRDYIETYMSIVSENATMAEAKAALEAKYPDYILPGILAFSLSISYPSDSGEGEGDAPSDGDGPTTVSCEDDASQLDVDVYWSGEEGTYVSSLLIKGEEEAILVGAQNNLDEGQNVADWIEESGKKLNSIFISHANPNRIQGIQAILDKYPDTPVYAAPDVVEDIKSAGFYVPTPYEPESLVLDGQCINILPFTQIDGLKNYTALYIPSTQTLFTADIATRGGHSVMAIGGPSYQNWFDAIDQLKTMDLKEVITGHAAPAFQEDRSPEVLDDTRDYLETYISIVSENATMEEAKAALEAKYPDYILPGILNFSLSVSYPSGEGDAGEGDSSTRSALETDVFVSQLNSGTSTLIKGEKNAILVDGLMTLSDGQKVADWVEESGKTLTAIWITHGHLDHYFGVTAILEKFPDTPVYSTAKIVDHINQGSAGYVQMMKQSPFADDIPDDPIVPEVYDQDTLELDGSPIEIISFDQGDTEDTTVLHIPDTQTVITGDIVVCGQHPLASEANTAQLRQEWINSVQAIKALNPQTVIAGHTNPPCDNSADSLDAMIKYLQDFNQAIEDNTNADDAIATLQDIYSYNNDSMLIQSVQAAYNSNGNGADTKKKIEVFVASNNFVTSTLIEGTEEAILVDAQFSADNAQKVVEMIEDSGKTLNAIWITHAHPDHFVGIGTLLDQFPNTPVYSTAEVANAISQKIPNWQEQFGLSADATAPEVRDSLELEGEGIEILSFAQGDTENTTAVYVPSLNTVIADDLVYCGAHSWQVETNAQDRSEWIDSLNQIKDMDPEFVVPGHKFPTTLDNDPACIDSNIEYIEKFSEVVETETTAEDAIAAMQEAYPDYQLVNVLEMSMQAQYSN